MKSEAVLLDLMHPTTLAKWGYNIECYDKVLLAIVGAANEHETVGSIQKQ